MDRGLKYSWRFSAPMSAEGILECRGGRIYTGPTLQLVFE